MQAAIISYVADAALQHLMTDLRLATSGPFVKDKMRYAVTSIIDISSRCWTTLAAAANMSGDALRDVCVRACMIKPVSLSSEQFTTWVDCRLHSAEVT